MGQMAVCGSIAARRRGMPYLQRWQMDKSSLRYAGGNAANSPPYSILDTEQTSVCIFWK
jgi:hypothetical protein